MNYQQRMQQHLGIYKSKVLGINEPGVFQYKGRDVLHAHILPVGKRMLNLLPLARPAFPALKQRYPTLKLHRYFHHLTSSQAFALNLFAPFFQGSPEAAKALLGALGQAGDLMNWTPEAVPDSLEGTNFDALWQTTETSQTFCEVKLTESGFGTANNDDRHQKKFAKIYLPRLEGRIASELLEPKAFFRHYQILRNYWHLAGDPSTRLVFLLPRANEASWGELNTVMGQLSDDLRARSSCHAIEDVLATLAADASVTGDLGEHVRELQRKYFLPA